MKEFKTLNDADFIIVNVSGGKDSTYLLDWACKYLPKEKIYAVHAIVDLDWSDTQEVVQKQCDFFGVPLQFVQATHKDGTPKGILSKLTSPRTDRKTGQIKENMFPGPSTRWCTNEVKTAPISKYVRTFKGNIAVLLGERREESNQRAKLEFWRPDEKLTKKDGSRIVINMSPILEVTEKQVWDRIDEIGAPVHPCYEWGVKRCSCAICIFSSDSDIEVAMEHEPNLVKDYIEAEKKISHTFRYKPATKSRPAIKETIQDIVTRILLKRRES
jgi:3'-phosphoadenosine 5'-phosphosulfate sulfotransferase (PAPS reductase)/FAD synthetase